VEVKKASERDKAYIRRLGEIQDEANEAWRREWAGKPLHERLEGSFSLARRSSKDVRDEAEEPEKFYERARRLGLIRG
jgi:hypothetical protein